jgi:hypothetical protein
LHLEALEFQRKANISSQSPYGAKWFAPYPPKNAVLDGAARGGFVRKMKLGICMGRITGVFGGLCR